MGVQSGTCVLVEAVGTKQKGAQPGEAQWSLGETPEKPREAYGSLEALRGVTERIDPHRYANTWISRGLPSKLSPNKSR